MRERAGGVLSALRREKPRDTAPDGCDPAVFAAQCAEYLERAHAERDLAASVEATRVEDAVADPIVEESVVEEAAADPIVEEWSVPEPAVAETFTQSPVVPEAIAHEAIAREESPVPPPPARARAGRDRASRLPVRESAAIHTVSQAIASLSQMFEEQVEESHPEQEQAVQEQEAPVEPELPAGMIELDLSTILEDAADRVAEEVDEPEVYDLAMPVETDDGMVEAEFVAALAESERAGHDGGATSADWDRAPGRLGSSVAVADDRRGVRGGSVGGAAHGHDATDIDAVRCGDQRAPQGKARSGRMGLLRPRTVRVCGAHRQAR